MKYEIRLIAFVYLREDGIIVSVRRVLFLLVRLVYMKKRVASLYQHTLRNENTRLHALRAAHLYLFVSVCIYSIFHIHVSFVHFRFYRIIIHKVEEA